MIKPSDAEYLYNNTYYKKGTYYALYYSKGGWKASAGITNLKLIEVGKLL